jgi:hypothetical protein
MKTQKNGLPLQIEGYPINIDKNKRNFKVFLQHRNGDQTINGWRTYDEAVKEIKTLKKEYLGTDLQVADFQILLDNTNIVID